MVTCDVFEAELRARDQSPQVVEYLLYSDLPAGTQVVLSCQRTFYDMAGKLSIWPGWGDTLIIDPSIYGDFNGIRGTIDVGESDAEAFELFKDINRSCGRGIRSRVSDELTIIFTVGARQRLRIFGKNNCNLDGQMVHQHGGINIVEIECKIVVPMQDEFQPIGSDGE